ncbi:hypothetical protein JCM21714_2219 [Gracilibacillus boraciitolerans JCM 21714]|uniref:Uncharacterized protein n=1 Tax=Gracilibacillus boraciitolerans JCM 21714 TaxID=1298598 RepID=W4VIX8_9BACI|nr:hypothetical protein [Gracilibacillus boraciitolerans]GAE93167.1 hypothetical protein JCM21714_2219 [Gracilibacillus boraciitolerans JCM 21714]
MTGKTHIMGGFASTVAIAHSYTYEPILFFISGSKELEPLFSSVKIEEVKQFIEKYEQSVV